MSRNILILGVVKLISALLSTNIYEINVQFRNLKTIDILLVRTKLNIYVYLRYLYFNRGLCTLCYYPILIIFQDLFFKYSLNNFLHAQVEQCITFLFTWNPQQQLPDISKTVPEESFLEKNENSKTMNSMTTEHEGKINHFLEQLFRLEGKKCFSLCKSILTHPFLKPLFQ